MAKTYAKWVELTDGMAQQVIIKLTSINNQHPHHFQVLEYHTNLVATVVLSDPAGQDWAASKPYRDGESVRMMVMVVVAVRIMVVMVMMMLASFINRENS